MDRLFNKKSKNLRQSALRHISLGIPTNVTAGPLGFQAERDIGPKGERDCSYRDLEADKPDLTVALAEKDARASRIVFHDEASKDKESPTPGAIIGDDRRGNDPTSECS